MVTIKKNCHAAMHDGHLSKFKTHHWFPRLFDLIVTIVVIHIQNLDVFVWLHDAFAKKNFFHSIGTNIAVP